MFEVVDYKNGKLGIIDSDDLKIEWYVPSDVKKILKDFKGKLEIFGCVLAENINPLYTLDGLSINFNMRYTHRFTIIGRFLFVILEPGDVLNVKTPPVKKLTVAIFDLGASNHPKHIYPSGQYICSYYASDLVKHKDGYGLVFQADVKDWCIDARDVRELKEFIKYNYELEG